MVWLASLGNHRLFQHLHTQTRTCIQWSSRRAWTHTLSSTSKLHTLISMQYSQSPLKKWVGNWWRYQFCRRWWRMPLLKALIRLEHSKSVIIFLSVWRVIFCQRHHVLTDLQGKQLLGDHHAIQGFHIHPIFPEQLLQTPRLFKAARDFFLAFEDTPPSISPQLPLKHNRCLPTRLPSTSCLVTTSPLLSTTERLANSMSVLNLESLWFIPLTGLTEVGCTEGVFLEQEHAWFSPLALSPPYWNQKLPPITNRYSLI